MIASRRIRSTFSSFKGGTILRDLPEEDLKNTQTIMLNMDPPQHSKYRRLVSQGFTPRMTAALEPHIRAATRRDRRRGRRRAASATS